MNKPALLPRERGPAGTLRCASMALLALSGVCLLSGCAYFNTYYNAKKLYDQAGRSRAGFPDTAKAGGAEARLYQKSSDKFAMVVSKYPSSRWAAPSLYHLAEATFRRGEYQKAQGLYEDVWHFYPGSKYANRARLGFALACWRMGEHERGRRLLASITSAESRVMERSAFLYALIGQSMGDTAEAALQWERFLYQHPKSGLANQARFQRAQCLVSLGDRGGAIAELNKLLSSRLRKAFRIQARLLLASALEQAGKPDEALALYRSLEKTATDQGDLRTIALRLARIQASSQDPPQARSIFLELAAKHPRTETSAGAYLLVAELWEQENVMDSARAYYNLARQESPGSTAAEEALRSASDIAMLQALGSLASDEKAREQNAAVQFLMAEHYLFQLNQPDQAIEKYGLVAASYPDLPIAAKSMYAAGWVQLSAKADTAAADSIFSQLVGRYPLTRYANAARERLGLPWDTTVADQEPDVGLSVPITLPLDTASVPRAPADSVKAPDPAIPGLPDIKPRPPGEETGKEGMIEGTK